MFLSRGSLDIIQIDFPFAPDPNKPSQKNSINVLRMFRLLGMTDIDQIRQTISYFVKPEYLKKVEYYLRPTFLDLQHLTEDVDYISRLYGLDMKTSYDERHRKIQAGILDFLFPKIPADEIMHKLYELSLMVAYMAEYLAGVRPLDDRDSWSNKRLETAPVLMSQLFVSIMIKLTKELQETVRTKNLEDLESIYRSLQHKYITDNFITSFSSNNWGVQGSYHVDEAVTDYLKRDSALSVYSHLTRVKPKVMSQTKQSALREVHMSALGYVCPVETPEGEMCESWDSEVIMGDNTIKRIGDLKDGDTVLTIDPMTLQQSTTKIYKHFVVDSRKINKNIIKIESISGRSVVCTEDHPFLTQYGWVKSGELDSSVHLIGVWPGVTPVPHVIEEKTILSMYDFLQCLTKLGVPDTCADKHVEKLSDLNLLPLSSQHPLLPTIARIAGFCMADGSLMITKQKHYPRSQYCFGTEYDAQLFQTDMTRLGFDNNKISYTTSTIVDRETGRESTHNAWVTSYQGAPASLLLALGMMHGKRVNKSHMVIPNWIMNGSQLVKREFLAGFQGGDGGKMGWTKRHGKVKAGKFWMETQFNIKLNSIFRA